MIHYDERLTVDELIDALSGTCNTFDPDIYTEDELGELDGVIFECVSCGWWHDRGEESEAQDICHDCWEDGGII